MTPRHRHTAALVAALALLPLAGCFTGIDSTPRIKAPGGDGGASRLSEADALLAHVAAEPPARWRAGKAWVATDERLALLLRPAATGEAVAAVGPGDTLRLVATDEAVSIAGTSETVLLLEARGGKVRLPLKVDARRFGAAEAWQLPFTVELAMVEAADSALRGRRAWVLNRDWHDGAGRLFEAVEIDGVTPGSEQHPLRVGFHALAPDSLDGWVDVSAPGADTPRRRTLGAMFALADPWRNYPDVLPETRALIAAGLIAPGMTTAEVRLALGPPADIARGGSTSTRLTERWTYDNGRILRFEDGLLTADRK